MPCTPGEGAGPWWQCTPQKSPWWEYSCDRYDCHRTATAYDRQVTPTWDGPRTGHQVMKDHAFIPVCRCLCAVFLLFYFSSSVPLLRTGVR